jgi:2-polyprenyl-3-methyl-5-hydroxy-6-metoxy-1,4-benzoquinol methylase
MPPAQLRVRVAGTAEPIWFLESGRQTATTVEQALHRHGLKVDEARQMLDFGCGCGRVMRHWANRKPAMLQGCDRDSESIRWCTNHLSFASFVSHDSRPPLPYSPQSFDAVYAISVFTHLPEEDQSRWLRELARVLRPGGLLVVTVHGVRYLNRLDPVEQDTFQSGGLVVRWPSAAGTNLCTAFHPERAIHRMANDDYELLELTPGGAVGTPYQDLVVLRRRAQVSADS